MNIELNHFLAGFNVKMNNQNVSATPKSGPGPLPMWVINLVTRMVQTSYVDRGPKKRGTSPVFQKNLIKSYSRSDLD